MVTELIVMMMKSEQVAGCIEAAPVPPHAKAALPACVLDVKSVAFQNAAARLALTSQEMQKIETPETLLLVLNVPFLF